MISPGHHAYLPQVLDYQDYQLKTGIRVLKFGVEPEMMGLAPGPCGGGKGQMVLTPAMPLGISGVRPTAVFDADGLWR